MGRNPATGEAIKIKASKKIAFRASKDLKEDHSRRSDTEVLPAPGASATGRPPDFGTGDRPIPFSPLK
jgi:hypothetical protein